MIHHTELVKFITIFLNCKFINQRISLIKENAFVFDGDDVRYKKAKLSQKTLCMISQHEYQGKKYKHYGKISVNLKLKIKFLNIN